MWNKLIIFIVGLGLLCSHLKAQEPTNQSQEQADSKSQDRLVGLSFVPQHLFKRGFRIDFEYRFKNSPNSLVLAPIYYGGNLENDEDGIPEDELIGYGAELIHKIYLNDQKQSTDPMIYLGHGPFWRRFQVDFQIREWVERQNGDLTLFERDLTTQTRTINKYGYNFLLGITVAQQEGFLVDLFFGGGIRVTSTSTTQNISAKPNRSFENSFIDYGYNGPVPILGIKFGAHL